MRNRAALRVIVTAASVLFAAAPATASEIYFCKTLVTRPINGMDEEAEGVPAEELSPSVRRGTIIRHVTQYVVNRKTGLTGFCAHFDRCYRDTATVHGRRLKAQRLLNCTVDFKHRDQDGDEIIYGLVAKPGKVSANDIRALNAFEGLLKVGIESERLAYALAAAPRSRCARIARRALAGDRRARSALANGAAPPLGDGMETVLDHLKHPDIYRDCV